MTTGDVRTRIDTGGTNACPHFSRDGKRLTYAASRTGGEYGTQGDLDLFAHDLSSDDTTGAHDVALTDDPARDDYGNASPDDTQMVFISDREGNAEVLLVPPLPLNPLKRRPNSMWFSRILVPRRSTSSRSSAS